MRRREVKGRAFDGSNFAGRDKAGVRRRHLVSEEREVVVKDRSFRFAVEVEVNVLGHVDGRGLVSRRLVLDAPDVVGRQSVGDFHFHVPGEALFAVRALIGEYNADRVAFLEGDGFPDLGVPAFKAAVQAAGKASRLVVSRQFVFRSVEREFAKGDAVAVAADQRAKVGVHFLVALDVVEAQDAVLELSISVGQEQFGYFPAVVVDFHFDSARALQGVGVHVFAGTRLRQKLRSDVSFRFFHKFFLILIVVDLDCLLNIGWGIFFLGVFTKSAS